MDILEMDFETIFEVTFFCSSSHSITLWPRAEVTCSNQLSQRFGIFDLVDLVEKMTYEWKTTIMDILSIFFFFFCSCFTGGAIKGSCPGIKWQAQQWTTVFRAAGTYRDVGDSKLLTPVAFFTELDKTGLLVV